MSSLVQNISNEEFLEKVTRKDADLGLVLVDFWAPWCGPCLQLAPLIDELATEMDGKVTVYKLNIDEYREAAIQNQVRSIPTLLLFKNGVLIDRHVGLVPSNNVQDLVKFVSNHL